MASLQTLTSSATTRSGKGAPVAHTEMDGNLSRAQSNFAVVNSNMAILETLRPRAMAYFVGNSVAIQASVNVSTITRVGTGVYTLTFSEALTDANYVIAGAATPYVGSAYGFVGQHSSLTRTTSGASIVTMTYAGSLFDPAFVGVQVLR